VSEFSDWLTATMKARKLSLRSVAERAGVGHTTVRAWREGIARPSWENCIAIAKALRVDDALVRSLAGYSDLGGDTYIAEATLSPEEETIVRAYRDGDDEARRLLIASARVVLRIAAGSDGAAHEEPQSPPGDRRRRAG